MEIKLMQAWQKCSQTGTVSCSVLRQNSNWLCYFKNLYLCSAFGLNVLVFTEKCRHSMSVVIFYFLLNLIDFKLGENTKSNAQQWITRNVIIPSEQYGAKEIKNSALLVLHMLIPSMVLILCFGYLTLDPIFCSREMIKLLMLINDYEYYNEKHKKSYMFFWFSLISLSESLPIQNVRISVVQWLTEHHRGHLQ